MRRGTVRCGPQPTASTPALTRVPPRATARPVARRQLFFALPRQGRAPAPRSRHGQRCALASLASHSAPAGSPSLPLSPGRQIAVTKSHGGALRAPLPARKAIELANYLFTPCGWSSAVRHLELHDAGEARAASRPRAQSVLSIGRCLPRGGWRQTDSGDVSLLASARVDLRVHGWCRVEGCGQHTARGEGVGPAVKVRSPCCMAAVCRALTHTLRALLLLPPVPGRRPIRARSPTRSATRSASCALCWWTRRHRHSGPVSTSACWSEAAWGHWACWWRTPRPGRRASPAKHATPGRAMCRAVEQRLSRSLGERGVHTVPLKSESRRGSTAPYADSPGQQRHPRAGMEQEQTSRSNSSD